MSMSTISRNGSIRRVAAGQGGDVRTATGQGGDRQRSLDQARRNRLREGRAAEWRRPVGAASGGAGTGARVSRAGHQVQPAPALSNTWVVAIAAAVLLVVGGAAFAVRGMDVVDTSTTIAVVQVQPGDTLGSIAARNAPGLAVSDVVGQIRALNDIPSVQVRVGQSLRVPVTAGR